MQFLRKHSLLLTSLLMVGLCFGVTYAYPKIADYVPPAEDCTAIIYTHEDPATVLDGTSPCIPCNRLAADLKERYKIKDGGGRIIGTRSDSIFRVVQAPPQMANEKLPLIVYYYDNGTKDYIQGYTGNHREVALKHPAFGGRGGKRQIASTDPDSRPEMHLISYKGPEGFQLKGGAKVQTLTWEGEEVQPTEDNYTPFLPELPVEAPRSKSLNDDTAVAQCGLGVQIGPFGMSLGSPYAQNCAASSYAMPYAQNCAASSAIYAMPSSCNGGIGGGGGGGDFYTPPQLSYGYNPYGYQPVYRAPVQRTYPVYAQPSYGYQNYQPAGRRMVCGPDGCYYVN